MATLSINQFLDGLGVQLAVRRASWDAIDDTTDTVIMKLWFHEVEPNTDGTSIRVWTPIRVGKGKAPIGRSERKRSIAHLEAGRPTYAIMRYGEGSNDPEAQRFDMSLRKLSGVDRRENGDVYVKVERVVSVDEYHACTRGGPVLLQDIAEIESKFPNLTQATRRLTLVQARLGQGKYRSDLLALWNRACAVTGCSVNELLVASHAKAWATSDDEERLDPANGLPLIANLDRLFNNYLISFDPETGEMCVSDSLSDEDRAMLGVPAPLRKKPTKQQAIYLRHHVEKFLSTQKA